MSELESLMKPYLENGTITCAECFTVARKSKTSLKDLSDLCNVKKIRIRSCQLGCFE